MEIAALHLDEEAEQVGRRLVGPGGETLDRREQVVVG
jgi:hypothetical protein